MRRALALKRTRSAGATTITLGEETCPNAARDQHTDEKLGTLTIWRWKRPISEPPLCDAAPAGRCACNPSARSRAKANAFLGAGGRTSPNSEIQVVVRRRRRLGGAATLGKPASFATRFAVAAASWAASRSSFAFLRASAPKNTRNREFWKRFASLPL